LVEPIARVSPGAEECGEDCFAGLIPVVYVIKSSHPLRNDGIYEGSV
jgi:hypothetical protein